MSAKNGCFLHFRGVKYMDFKIFEGRNFGTFLCLWGVLEIGTKSWRTFRLMTAAKPLHTVAIRGG